MVLSRAPPLLIARNATHLGFWNYKRTACHREKFFTSQGGSAQHREMAASCCLTPRLAVSNYTGIRSSASLSASFCVRIGV